MTRAKGFPVAPLTGLLDTRSSPDLMPAGALRWRQNLQTISEGRVRRGCGWEKLLSSATYNNQDLHDQLLTFTTGAVREPVTLLYESESAAGVRSLWAATQSRIFRLTESTGNWKLMGDGFGGGSGTDCTGPRFKAGVSGDYLIFTNGYDKPQVHRLEQPPFDSTLFSEIDDLNTIGLSQAAHVWVWKDVVFLADVTMDNLRHGNRIVWGDYRNPLSFDPAKVESIAGYKDLNFGERILAGMATNANTFLIYTTKSIWEITVVGGEQVFAWREAYPGQKNDFAGILAHENTLIDLGGEHLYLAKDGPYVFSGYRSAPERAEWLHRAMGTLYADLDTETCEAHIGWTHDREGFFSVKRTTDSGCPGITIRFHLDYKVADIMDHGFTAACNFRSQPVQNIRDFILDYRICTLATLDAQMTALFSRTAFENEGLPSPFATPTAAFTPTCIYSSVEYEPVAGIIVEDYTQEAASQFSVCTLLGDLKLSDICQTCAGPSLLVLASAEDWCLKQYGGVFYRERCANTTAVGSSGTYGYTTSVGSYVQDPYDSLVRFAPLFAEGLLMIAEGFKLNGIPAVSATPASLQLRVGASGQTGDPNDDLCLIVWQDRSTKLLQCVTTKTAAQHLSQKTVPAQPLEWRFQHSGAVLYFELKIAGTGGDCTLSGVVADLHATPKRNY